jgi:phage shock protein A
MWARVKRLFRSIFGGLIESAEDPELILQQTIRDMREKVPQMQNNVVQVMATEKLLQKEVVILEREIKDYDAKVKASISTGRDDIAQQYLMQALIQVNIKHKCNNESIMIVMICQLK